MKVLKKDASKCVGCDSCADACAKLWGGKARIKITPAADGGHIITACTQCGECIAVCPGVALERDKNGIVKLNSKRCVGCMMCVGFCPELAMFHGADTEPWKCVACGACAKVCPTGAIYIHIKESEEALA